MYTEDIRKFITDHEIDMIVNLTYEVRMRHSTPIHGYWQGNQKETEEKPKTSPSVPWLV